MFSRFDGSASCGHPSEKIDRPAQNSVPPEGIDTDNAATRSNTGRHSLRIVCTKRSANAFRLGDSGANFFTFPPSLRMISSEPTASRSCHHFVTTKKRAP
jgi:hypothetical protein